MVLPRQTPTANHLGEDVSSFLPDPATVPGTEGFRPQDREDAAQAVAERMDTGSVGLNFFGSNHNAPLGGRHDSGLGVEYGIEGLSQYVTYKSIHRQLR